MKNVILSLLALLAVSLLYSCDNDPAGPDPVTFLTIELKQTFMDNAADKWVFATNENGETLDAVQLQEGTTQVELKTAKAFTTIDFTIFSYYDVSPSYFALETFKDFPANESIALGITPGTQGVSAGIAHITVTNYQEEAAPTLNVKFSTQRYGTYGATSAVVSGTNYSVDVMLGPAIETVHVYGLRSGIPVYKMLTNVVPDQSLTVDFSTFEPFENFVPLNFYGYAYTVGVREDGSQFELVSATKQFSSDPRQIYAATVPGFAKYLTYFSSYSFGFEYWRIGTPVTSFTIPSYTTTIQNNSVQNFEAAITDTHDYKSVEFRAELPNLRTNWKVSAPGTGSLGIDFAFPEALDKAYPSLSFAGLEYYSSAFYRSFGTYTYKDMLDNRFKNVLRDEFELYTLTSK